MFRLFGVCTTSYNVNQRSLYNIELETNSNGLIFITGPEDSGKTALTKVLAGLSDYSSGSVLFNGTEIKNYDNDTLLKYRNYHCSYMFKEGNVLDNLSVEDNINMLLDFYGYKPKADISKYLEYTGLDKYKETICRKLSLAKKQLLSLACSLIRNTDVIVCDDPTRELSATDTHIFMDILVKVSKHKLIIITTRNEDIAKQYADRILTIASGYIVEDKPNERPELSDARKDYYSISIDIDISELVNTNNDDYNKKDNEVIKTTNANKYLKKITFDNFIFRKYFIIIAALLFSFISTERCIEYNILTYDYTTNYVQAVSSLDRLSYTLQPPYDVDGVNYYHVTDTVYYNYLTNIVGFSEEDIVYTYTNGFYTTGYVTTYSTTAYALHDDYDYTKLGFDTNPIENYDEVIITSAVAHNLFGEEMQVNRYIGKTFTPDDLEIELTVVGIIDTNYKNKQNIISSIESEDTEEVTFTNDEHYQHLGIYTSRELYSINTSKNFSNFAILNDSSFNENARRAFENNINIVSASYSRYELLYKLTYYTDYGEQTIYTQTEFTAKIIVFSTLLAIGMIICLHIHTNSKHKDMSILNERGYSNRQIRKIYFMNILALFTIILVVSLLLSTLMLIRENYNVTGGNSSFGVDKLEINTILITSIVIINVLFAIISYLYILIKLAVKKPMLSTRI